MSKAWPVPGINPDESVATNARRILAARMAEFASYAPIVHDPNASEQLHNLRIATKRLRYTLELFREVFGEVGERQIERAKAIQQVLGDLHDHDVRIGLIQAELDRLNDHGSGAMEGTRRGLEAFLARERHRREECYRAFVELWDRLTAEGMRRDLALLSSDPVFTAVDE